MAVEVPDRRPTRVTPGTPSAWRWRRPAISPAGSPSCAGPLDLAVRGGDVADAAGIHRHLWRLLVAEGGAAELVETTIADAETARAPGDARARRGARRHRRRLLPPARPVGRGRRDAHHLDPGRLDGIVQLVVAALLDVDRGDVERAGDRLETVRADTFGLRDGGIDGLLFRGLAERAWSRGHRAPSPRSSRRGLQRTTDPEMSGWLALVGLRAAEERAAGVDGWLDRLRGLGEYAERRRLGPAAELRSAAATGEAELGRLRRHQRPAGAGPTPSPPGSGPGSRCPPPTAGGAAPRPCCSPAAAASEAADLFAAAGSARRRARGAGRSWRRSSRRRGGRGCRRSAARAAEPAAGAAGDSDFGITARELEVLELLARGWTNKQIAEALFISEKTARVHVSHLLSKLGVPTRGAAVDVAHRHGLLDRR